jgi:hypothetical protein
VGFVVHAFSSEPWAHNALPVPKAGSPIRQRAKMLATNTEHVQSYMAAAKNTYARLETQAGPPSASLFAPKVIQVRERRIVVAFLIAFAICVAQVRAQSSAAPRAQIVLSRASSEWMSQQIEEPCILPNPKVPGRLIMFYGAVPASNRSYAAIGKAWAAASDPFTWHQDEANPIFRPGQSGWDSATIRLDCVLYIPEEDAYYIYYSGTTETVQDRIGLAICPVGKDGYSEVTADNIRRYGGAPVLAPDPTAPYFEAMASQSAVLREWNEAEQRWNWYLYYSYRGKDGVLPGIRLAVSNDGKNWTRQFNDNDPRGMGHLFESTPSAYYEWHQVFKTENTYVLCIEVGIEHGKRWRPVLAVSNHPIHGWTQLDPDTMLQTSWQGLYNDNTLYHVATPALYRVDDDWYLFCQACGRPSNDNYIDGAWEMWAITCTRTIPIRPGCAAVCVP